MKRFLQKLGSSLMLPVAVLPAAAVLMGIGYAIDPNVMAVVQTGAPNSLAILLVKAGSAIIDNMAWLFAIGIGFGMAKEKDATAGLAAIVSMYVITTLLNTGTVAAVLHIDPAEVAPAYSKIVNVFTGIISGLIAAYSYNTFHTIKLPTALSFFNGKRFVPIMTAVFSLIASGILWFIWPPIYAGLVSFGEWMIGQGAFGAGLYGFFNRLLIPTGLHHALNSVFWFDVAGISDIGKFWTGIDAVKGVTGMYQAGFFPIMMFGLPGGALAMYHTAKTNKRKIAAGILISASFAAFFTGVTEPLEFSFMFLAPILYLVHAVLTGISLLVAALLHTTAGFAFSAGLIDYVLSFNVPQANKPWMLLILGAIFFVVYYVVFRFFIKMFDLKTVGREDDEIGDEEKNLTLSNDNYSEMAKVIYEGLGGDENVQEIDNCITRLRVTVKDSTLVDDNKIKSTGVPGVIKPGKNNVQVIVGTTVQSVADEMKKLRK